MQQVFFLLHHLHDLGSLNAPNTYTLSITDPTEGRPKVTLITELFLVDVSRHHSNLPCGASQSLFSVPAGKPAKKVSRTWE